MGHSSLASSLIFLLVSFSPFSGVFFVLSSQLFDTSVKPLCTQHW